MRVRYWCLPLETFSQPRSNHSRLMGSGSNPPPSRTSSSLWGRNPMYASSSPFSQAPNDLPSRLPLLRRISRGGWNCYAVPVRPAHHVPQRHRSTICLGRFGSQVGPQLIHDIAVLPGHFYGLVDKPCRHADRGQVRRHSRSHGVVASLISELLPQLAILFPPLGPALTIPDQVLARTAGPRGRSDPARRR